MCRKSATELAQLIPILSKLDIQVVAIGTGSVRSIAPFREDTGFAGPIWIDSSAKLYKFLACRRGLRSGLMNSKTMEAVKIAWAQGYRMRGLDGHLFQLGGMFVVYNGEIVWEHHDEYAGHTPDYLHLMAACGVPKELIGDLSFVHPIDLNPSLKEDVSEFGSPSQSSSSSSSGKGKPKKKRRSRGSSQ